MPDFDLIGDYMASDAARALRGDVRAFLDEETASGRVRPGRQTWTTYDRAFSERCGARGYIGMVWPRAVGGGARHAFERYLVTEELLAGGAPLGAHWIADRQSGPQILRHGTDALKARILPEIAAGRCTFGIGMSEPDAGSDLSAIRTRAERTEGGWRLNGRKIWTTNAHHADYMIVLCRTAPASEDRYAGMSQLVVPLAADGVEVSAIRNMLGEREFNEVVFDDVIVPDSHLLGTGGDGWKLVMQELSFERSGPDRFLSTFPLLAALSQGGSDGGAEAELGQLVSRLVAVRRLSLDICARLAAGEPIGADASMMKEFGTTLEQEVPEAARRLTPVRADPSADGLAGSLAFSRLSAPCFSLRGGTREILKGIIARELGLR